MIKKISEKLNRIIEIITIFLMGSMLIVILIQSFSRYALNKSTPWTAEIALYLMVWIAMLGASIIVKEDKHAAILFLLNKFSFKNIIKIKLLHNLVILVFLYFLITGGVRYALNNWNSISPATGIRRTFGYMAIPAGGVFMSIQLISNSLENITVLLTKKVKDKEIDLISQKIEDKES